MPKTGNTRKPPLPTTTKSQARRLRTTSTDGERAIWYHLRAGRLGGLKFRRQHPIPPFIVDFYCEKLKLVVEVDGSQHNPRADAGRTRFLEQKGLTVLRFHANDAVRQTSVVVEAIWNLAGRRTLTPTPLPEGEGLKTERRR
jgi:very-short-patch-repair endonuclease